MPSNSHQIFSQKCFLHFYTWCAPMGLTHSKKTQPEYLGRPLRTPSLGVTIYCHNLAPKVSPSRLFVTLSNVGRFLVLKKFFLTVFSCFFYLLRPNWYTHYINGAPITKLVRESCYPRCHNFGSKNSAFSYFMEITHFFIPKNTHF